MPLQLAFILLAFSGGHVCQLTVTSSVQNPQHIHPKADMNTQQQTWTRNMSSLFD